MPDRRIKGRPLTDLLDTASEIEELERQKRDIDARLNAARNSQGELLRSARNEAGLTMSDLASSLGTSQSYVSQVENGVRGVSSNTLMRFYDTISSSSGNSGAFTWNVSGVPLQEEEHGNEVNAGSTNATSTKAGRKA